MDDDLKEKLIEVVWNFWYDNEVSWGDIFSYLAKEFPIEIMRRLESQLKEIKT